MPRHQLIPTLHPGLQRVIREKNWKHGLSEIQQKAIPVILNGTDCIIEAPTAGGKTEAVLFPALTRAARDKKEDKKRNKKKSVQILYLAPLRALLNNVEKRARQYAGACGLHCFKWHGDVDQKEKIRELQCPSQLLLTTPESLEAILLRKAGWREFFSRLETVIIDEAHNFAFGDRGGHLAALLERLEKSLGLSFQRIALTATVGNPGDLLKWLAGGNRATGKHIFVSSGSPENKDYRIQFYDRATDDGVSLEKQSHIRQFHSLYRLLPNKKTIVFGGSRKKTEELAAAVRKMNELKASRNPVNVRTHHSSVSKYYREEAEKLIQLAGESGLHAIVSTSTLELGIDIGELDLVVQVGALVSPGAFLQRVGRTGRREGKKKYFRGLCTARDDLILLAAVVNLGISGVSESFHLSRKAYHLLAHQLICLSLQNNGVRVGEAWETLCGAYCFKDVTIAKFKKLIANMIQTQYLRDVDGELVAGEATEKYFLGSNWRRLFATFDSAPMYEVMEGKNQVGTLDASFVEALTVPFLFVLGGIEWKAEKVNTPARQVMAHRAPAGNAPRWLVFGNFDVPRETAKEAGRILAGTGAPAFLDDEALGGLEAARSEYKGLDWDDRKWILDIPAPGLIRLWTFAGDKINRTIALLAEWEKTGTAVSGYQYVEIQLNAENHEDPAGKITRLLRRIEKMSVDQLHDLEEKLSQKMRCLEFSKFSKCLPGDLWQEAMAERALDITGLKTGIMNITIEIRGR